MVLPLVLLLASASPELAAAQKAYGDVDYPRCYDRAQAALLVAGDRDDRVNNYRLLGLCAAAVGDTDEAREAFRKMLAIDREARLPDGLSPRFTSSYREAKGSWVGTVPLALSVAKDDTRVDGRTIIVKLDDDASMVSKIAWRSAGGEMSAPLKAASRLELELPVDVDVDVIGLDDAGGEVVILAVAGQKKDAATDLDRKAATVVEEDEGSPLTYVIIGGIAGAVILVGAAAGIAAVLLAPPEKVVLATDVAFAD